MLKLFLFLFSLSKGLDFVFLLEISVSNFMNRFLFVMHHCLQNAKGDTAHRRFDNTTRSHRRQWIKSVNAKSNIAAIVRLWDNINVNDLDCEDHLGPCYLNVRRSSCLLVYPRFFVQLPLSTPLFSEKDFWQTKATASCSSLCVVLLMVPLKRYPWTMSCKQSSLSRLLSSSVLRSAYN